MRICKWLLPLLAAAACAAQMPAEPPGLLERIRQTVASNLRELPNYTCQQTIERSARQSGSRRFTQLDTIRLEVAYVGGRELFGWPGAGKFEEKRIDELVGGNRAIGNGFFAAHARGVFVNGAAGFRYGGGEEKNGRSCVRYEYSVPRAKSEFVFRDGEHAAVAGYSGSFWVDAKTLDLVRLEVRVDDFPPGIAAKESNDALEYARVRIGGREFLLPQFAEMNIVDLEGNESRNTIRLAGCRQYVGESVLKFDEGAAPETAPMPAVSTLALPPGLEIETALAAPLESAPAIGDPVKTTVLRDARKDGRVLVPKGSTVSGRITRFEKRRTRAFEYFVLGIAFHSFEGRGVRGDFAASIEHVGSYGNQYFAPLSHGLPGPLSVWSSMRGQFAGLRPGEGIIYIRGDSPRMAAGVPISLMVAGPDGGSPR